MNAVSPQPQKLIGWPAWLRQITPQTLLMVLPIAIASTYSAPSFAQSVIPEANGTATIVTKDGNRYVIDGGTLSGDGGNLFHSFEQLGLSSNEIATFLSDPTIQNILGRVVGGDPSFIDGLLQVTGGDSNLFLMNPAGIVFGSNVQLDLSGSFSATTATSIEFEDGWFDAVETGDFTTLIGDPTAYRFGVQEPGTIINAGTLAVEPGEGVSLVGGTVISTGTIEAPGGQITVMSVPGTSRVRLQQPGWVISLEVDVEMLAEGGGSTIAPWDLPRLLTEGAPGVETGLALTEDNLVQLERSGVTVPDAVATTIVGGQINAANRASQQTGGDVAILGNRVALVDVDIDVSGDAGGGRSVNGGELRGNGTLPNATRTYMSEDSRIRADGGTSGDGGEVIVWANETTDFRGDISASGGSEAGNGGFVEVSGKENLFFRGTVNTNAANGEMGTLLLDPVNITIVNGSGASEDSQLNDGEILVDDVGNSGVPSLPIDNFTISEDALEALSANTELTLEASNDITIEDLEDNVLAFADGPGGDIEIVADADGDNVGDFRMDNSDTIRSIERNITIRGQNLFVGNIDSRVRNDQGTGGDIELRAVGNITVNGTGAVDRDNVPIDGLVTTDETEPVVLASFVGASISEGGTAGDITIVSETGFIDTTTGQVDASASGTRQSVGGDILIQAEGDIRTGDVESFAVREDDGPGIAGDITIISEGGSIDTTSGALRDVSANANRGTAGDITIQAEGNIRVNNVSAAIPNDRDGRSTAGSIGITSEGPISILNGEIDTVSGTGRGGDIDLVSDAGIQSIGDLRIDAEGNVVFDNITAVPDGNNVIGDIEITSRSRSIDSLGSNIVTSSNNGRAGNVTLRAPDNVDIGSINTQHLGNGSGGDVDITAGESVRASTSFVDQNGIVATVSSADSQDGGEIIIRHGGGQTNPFTVGDPSINGTAESLTSSEDNVIAPTQSFSSSYRQGNISILTPSSDSVEIQTLTAIPEPIDTKSPAEQLVEQVEASLTADFLDYFERDDDVPIKTLSIIQNELSRVEAQTTETVKPAVIYAFFIDPNRINVDRLEEIVEQNPQTLGQGQVGESVEAQLDSDLDADNLVDTANQSPQNQGGVSDDIQWQYSSDRQGSAFSAISPYISQEENPEKKTEEELVLLVITAHSEPELIPTKTKFGDIQYTADELSDAWRDGLHGASHSSDMYRYLIDPIEDVFDRQNININNLLFVMDTRLRSLPIAAFQNNHSDREHTGNFQPSTEISGKLLSIPLASLQSSEDCHLSEDSENSENCYLVQKYSVGLVPSMSLTDTRYRDVSQDLLLAMGTGDFSQSEEGLSSLYAVPSEKMIFDIIWPDDRAEISEQFTIEILERSLMQNEFRIVHLATHADFKDSDFNQSSIYFAEGEQLFLNEFPEVFGNSDDIELLTLSACKTAIGSREAELGFAGSAYQSGAKSVLASLTGVYDVSTAALMAQFYTELRSAPIKAVALQKAQIAMLSGNVEIRDGQIYVDGFEDGIPLQEPLIDLEPQTFEHPDRWAWFTLVGSPW